MLYKAVLAFTVSLFLMVANPKTATAQTTNIFGYVFRIREIISLLEERQSSLNSLIQKLEERRDQVLAETDSDDNEDQITPTISPTPTIISDTEQTSTPTSTPPAATKPDEMKNISPTEVPKSVNIGEYILNQVNEYRKSLGLSTVANEPYSCDFAKTRARELAEEFNHDGFDNRIASGTLPYPTYSTVTENIAMNSDFRKVFNMWVNSSGHAANMRADTPYVCIANYGNYYAYVGWKP